MRDWIRATASGPVNGGVDNRDTLRAWILPGRVATGVEFAVKRWAGHEICRQAVPRERRDFVITLSTKRCELAREGQFSAEPNGWVRYLLSLAWDVATLIHAGEPPTELIDRLRDRDNYQGARYELAIAAIFARLDCSIRWLDADPGLRRVKHVEFEATHRPTGQTFAVEAKSRHRAGVINHPGTPDPDDPLRADSRAVRRLFMNAVEKAPDDQPYFIFLDINAPSEADGDWEADVQRWMNRLPAPTEGAPDVFNATYITNFSPHYDGDDASRGGSWLVAWPRYARVPLSHDFQPELVQALNAYARVPAFAEDGTLLD